MCDDDVDQDLIEEAVLNAKACLKNKELLYNIAREICNLMICVYGTFFDLFLDGVH